MFSELAVLTVMSVVSADAAQASAPATPPAKAELPVRKGVDRIAAVIENEVITLRELETKARSFLAQLESVTDVKEREAKRRDVLQQVLDIEIGERLVTSELKQSKDRLGVTEADIDRAVQEVMRMNNVDEPQLQAALYGQGLTWAEYRQKLREQIERARLIQFKVQGRVQVQDADVKRRCAERQREGAREQQICASHILFRVPKGVAPDELDRIRGRASKIQAEVASGADFAAYALQYSDDKGTPNGSLGCFGKGEMVEAFERAAYALKVGEVSGLVRTEFGFHIIKVSDRKAAAAGSCDTPEALAPFQNEIYQEQMDREMRAWMSELRKKAFVEVRL